MMVTNEKVLDIFVDYLEKDQALDVVSTGAVMPLCCGISRVRTGLM